ncbi:MAG: hypothetical protein V7752_07660 [Halopseudomonas sp.]
MSNVVYLRTQAQVTEVYRVEQKGDDSWWVFCQPLAWDGMELLTSRPVFFSRFQSKAQAWADLRNGVAEARQRA